jgi:hypothetical protein
MLRGKSRPRVLGDCRHRNVYRRPESWHIACVGHTVRGRTVLVIGGLVLLAVVVIAIAVILSFAWLLLVALGAMATATARLLDADQQYVEQVGRSEPHDAGEEGSVR